MNKFLSLCFLGILISPNFAFAQNITSPTHDQYYQCPVGFVLVNYGGSTQKCVKKPSIEYQNSINDGGKEMDICSLNNYSECQLSPNCNMSLDKCITKGTVNQDGVTPPTISGGTTVTTADLGDKQCQTVGYSISKDDNCRINESKQECKADPNGYRCIPNASTSDTNISLFTTLEKLKYTTKLEIPCSTKIAGGTCPKATTPATYVTRLYQFGLMIVGLIALGAFIYGALQYTLSAGDFTSKEDAREQMKQAIYGILLLLSSYLILYTINPKLVTLSNPTIETPFDLSTTAPADTYISEDETSNTPTETEGNAITGCEVASSNSGWFEGLVEIDGQQSSGTGTSAITCIKCKEGNASPDSLGLCNCLANTVRQSNGICCPPDQYIITTKNSDYFSWVGGQECGKCKQGYTYKDNTCVAGATSGVCATGLMGADGNCCATGQVLSPISGLCKAKCPTGYDRDSKDGCNACAAGYKLFNKKCVEVIISHICASGYSVKGGGAGDCIPIQ